MPALQERARPTNTAHAEWFREPPPLGSHVIRRARVVRRFQNSGEARLLLLTAPPGYGKSTALAQWVEADTREFAWLRLTEHDDDPVRLAYNITQSLASLQSAGPSGPALRRAEAPLRETALPLLGAQARRLHEPVVLILDDSHVLRASGIRDVLDCVVESLRAGSMLVLAGRRQPALRLARLRAAGLLDEIAANELALTRGESLTLLRRAVPGITDARAESTAQRCEGWAAALYLSSIALRHEPEATSPGADLALDEYLEEEVLSRVSAADRAFLRRTSLLETLTGPLCDAALGREDSGRRLLSLARENVLVQPLDHRGERFKVHALFAETLRADLEREYPAEVAGIHRRAARWLGAARQDEPAVAHALDGHDLEWAAAHVWSIAMEWLGSGRATDLRRLISRFGPDALLEHPELEVLLAWCSTNEPGSTSARRHAEHAALADDRILADGTPLSAVVAAVQAGIAAHGVVRMGDDAAAALSGLPGHSPHLLMARFLQGAASVLAGRPETAFEQLEATERAAATHAAPIETMCLAQLSLIHAERDEWLEAAHALRRARSIQRAHQLEEYASQHIVFAASALVCAQAGDRVTARREAAVARPLMARQGDFAAWLIVQSALVLVRTALVLGDASAARALLTQAETHMVRVPDSPELQAQLAALRPRVQRHSVESALGSASLTAAEARVLGYLPQHYSMPQIAEQVGVSPNTIKTQVHAIYAKLGVSSRTDAVNAARQLGLLGV